MQEKPIPARARMLCEAQFWWRWPKVLSYLKLFELPQGAPSPLGLPIFLYCARWGFGPGLFWPLWPTACGGCS